MDKNFCFPSRKIKLFVATTNLTSLKLQMCYVLFHLLIILPFKGQNTSISTQVTYQLQGSFYYKGFLNEEEENQRSYLFQAE